MVADALLTIVVPAWKPRFLHEALASIAAQTDSRFRCVIFDDAGEAEVARICAGYPQFRYQRFAQNLGGQSLVAHWNRCLQAADGEWVWLFSDDDVMAPGCVAAFHAARLRAPRSKVFQFAVDMVDEPLRTVLWSATPPLEESAAAYLRERFAGRRLSCVPEHVFHWPTLRDAAGGFVDLPLAWSADDATWALLGRSAGIAGVPEAKVLWRQSAHNISHAGHRRWDKLGADLAYLRWLQAQGLQVGIGRPARWLGTRIVRLYGFGWRDGARLATRLGRARPGALAWAVLIALRDRLRPRRTS